MAITRKTTTTAKTSRRNHELKKILEERRRSLIQEVQGRIRDARTDTSRDGQVFDQGESSDVGYQEDIEFAVIQIQAETLQKIDAALRRLDDDTYGRCFDCDDEIAERRLRALPFAVRCRDCEELRETQERDRRVMAQRGSSSSGAGMFN